MDAASSVFWQKKNESELGEMLLRPREAGGPALQADESGCVPAHDLGLLINLHKSQQASMTQLQALWGRDILLWAHCRCSVK